MGRGAKERLCVGRVVCVLTERGGTKGKKNKSERGRVRRGAEAITQIEIVHGKGGIKQSHKTVQTGYAEQHSTELFCRQSLCSFI